MQHRSLFSTVIRKVFKNTKGAEKPSGVVSVTVENGCLSACLPSKYTPANKKVTELFKAGTEPTEVSNRYDKLSDVTNLEGTYKNGVVTLTWDKIKEPDAINEEYLNKYARKYLTKKEDIEYYVNTRLKEVYSEFGKVSYDVYVLQEKLEKSVYYCVQDFINDIELMWSNAINYFTKSKEELCTLLYLNVMTRYLFFKTKCISRICK